ncbi:MAG: hypothetical protein IPO48_15745 [Saprospiraceae bacterium]|nr:hypothetical protein [Saprospiraceae bacterium]
MYRTDNIQMTVDPAPTNNSCGTAGDLGSGTSPISVSGDNTCAGTGGGCGLYGTSRWNNRAFCSSRSTTYGFS